MDAPHQDTTDAGPDSMAIALEQVRVHRELLNENYRVALAKGAPVDDLLLMLGDVRNDKYKSIVVIIGAPKHLESYVADCAALGRAPMVVLAVSFSRMVALPEPIATCMATPIRRGDVRVIVAVDDDLAALSVPLDAVMPGTKTGQA